MVCHKPQNCYYLLNHNTVNMETKVDDMPFFGGFFFPLYNGGFKIGGIREPLGLETTNATTFGKNVQPNKLSQGLVQINVWMMTSWTLSYHQKKVVDHQYAIYHLVGSDHLACYQPADQALLLLAFHCFLTDGI